MTVAQQILTFYSSLSIEVPLPKEVEVMNPYQDATTFKWSEKFYHKFYNDHHQRTMIMGINPGRFGGGITGIPFTDPVKLEKYCGIPNDLKKKVELSADFIYAMITAFGGPDKFYHQFFFSAVSPLGFTQGGKNLNYYDVKELQQNLKPFIADCLKKQLAWGVNTKVCYCLGEGKNFDFLQKINNEYSFFNKIVPLPHPRFIMQYKRKKLNEYIDGYLQQLSTSL